MSCPCCGGSSARTSPSSPNWRPDVPTIRADRTQVQQVLLNLVVNARDAMPRGGLLTIRTSLTTVETRTPAGPMSRRGTYVVLEVTDTGQGMDAGHGRPHLRAVLHHQGVRPGHRPWPVDGVRHRQAERGRRAGAIHARSRRDVSRPAARRARRQAPRRRRPSRRSRQVTPAAGTVLLAEDDDGVREFVGEVLRASGWTVVHGGQPRRGVGHAPPGSPWPSTCW